MTAGWVEPRVGSRIVVGVQLEHKGVFTAENLEAVACSDHDLIS